jgi:hypothetical protein
MKIRQVVADLFHADSGRTDGRTYGQDEANSHSSQLCEGA